MMHQLSYQCRCTHGDLLRPKERGFRRENMTDENQCGRESSEGNFTQASMLLLFGLSCTSLFPSKHSL
ncbi:67aa long hypothetical protein [Pyrococcus horikoshii OT3]|uniref:Uncharacterized protein n=1 Tax=Pyrococcus horikoshii (strain ATCC 700860 / DSM 12428 / JCM 9974 / NBRC 100139 / OT-3) TaxID=70601 RepID=O73965_PYRHO|nr:67aa long hypothetical protein [Pyrococcus horikoshii OT3]